MTDSEREVARETCAEAGVDEPRKGYWQRRAERSRRWARVWKQAAKAWYKPEIDWTEGEDEVNPHFACQLELGQLRARLEAAEAEVERLRRVVEAAREWRMAHHELGKVESVGGRPTEALVKRAAASASALRSAVVALESE